YVIDVFIINMAIPAIQKGLNASNGQVQLIISAYLLGSASFLIIGGRTGDFVGKKKTFFWGMFFFTLTSCFCGLSQTPYQLIIVRFFQGISSSFMVPQAISFIQVLFPDKKERAKAIGYYGITLSIAAIIGQILGGALADINFYIAGWRVIFFINLPVGILALIAIRVFLVESKINSQEKFDYSGAFILTTGLACLIFPLAQGREQGWPLWSIGLIVFSIPVLCYFFYNQKKKLIFKRYPLINMELFGSKPFKLGLLAALFHFMLHSSFLLISAVYLQKGLGYSALDCGLYFTLHAVLFMISSIIAGRLIVRYGKHVLQFGLAIILTAFVLQMFLFKPPVAPITITLLIGVYGLGNGLVLPSLITLALNNVPLKFAGAASGTFSTFQQTASALGISILGGLFFFKTAGISGRPAYYNGFCYGLGADILFLGIVALMLYFLPATKTDANRQALHSE
ncbi:MAG: MFS transporter, partial [Mucilaginibacter sp.]